MLAEKVDCLKLTMPILTYDAIFDLEKRTVGKYRTPNVESRSQKLKVKTSMPDISNSLFA